MSKITTPHDPAQSIGANIANGAVPLSSKVVGQEANQTLLSLLASGKVSKAANENAVALVPGSFGGD